MKPVDWDEVKWKAMILAVLFAVAYIVTSIPKEAESKGFDLKNYFVTEARSNEWR